MAAANRRHRASEAPDAAPSIPGAGGNRGGQAVLRPPVIAAGNSRSGGGQVLPTLPALPRRPRGNRLRLTIRELSSRPGLQGMGAMLDRHPNFKLGVVPSKKIIATLECGSPLKQIVRASSSFHGTPWYDAVLYMVDDNSMRTPGGEDDPSHQPVLYLGESRAIINGEDEDMAVVCNMTPVPSPPSCPLSARECQRFKWAVSANGEDRSIAVVPIRRIVRVVHLVPDFGDVLRRRGPLALPTPIGGPVADVRARRYFVNPIYPWG